jgi:hypothetical protein
MASESSAPFTVRKITPATNQPAAYVHAAWGEVRLVGQELEPGDVARITGAVAMETTAVSPVELLGR